MEQRKGKGPHGFFRRGKQPAEQAKLERCPPGCGPHPPEDEAVFINPDGQAVPGTPPSGNCPRVIMVVANAHQQAPGRCDTDFDYQPLIDDAMGRISRFMDQHKCRDDCPFREFFTDPDVAEHIETVCSETGTDALYTAHIRFYFVCTKLQH